MVSTSQKQEDTGMHSCSAPLESIRSSSSSLMGIWHEEIRMLSTTSPPKFTIRLHSGFISCDVSFYAHPALDLCSRILSPLPMQVDS
mmetsp:Transcript_45690/g.177907  ORF Transcript_45690/g.177907 Transcript_45690/m.177907 type:complete len:87 (-) Transcript_45690:1376-1636(-)